MPLLSATLEYLWSNPIIPISLSLLGLLLIYFWIKRIRLKKLARQLDEIEVRYNTLKSVPLAFKLTKSEAMVELDENPLVPITNFKDDFETVQKHLKTIARLINDADDAIASSKIKNTKLVIQDLNAILSLLDTDVSKLDANLDGILEKEAELRLSINQAKEQLLTIKEQLNNQPQSLKHAEPLILSQYEQLDKKLIAFEEWMYVNEYDKAQHELKDIQTAVVELGNLADKLPKLLDLALGTLPTLISTIEKRYALALAQGASVVHLEVVKNLEVIKENIKQDYERLTVGDVMEVEVHIDNSLTRLNQLHDQVNREIDANADVDEIKKHFLETYNSGLRQAEAAETAFNQVGERFDFSLAINNIRTAVKNLQAVNSSYQKLNRYAVETKMSPATHCIELKQLLQKVVLLYDEINTNKSKIELVKQYEERAEQQLVKLQLIINEMLVKIKVKKLPSISADFDGDVNRALEYLNTIKNLLASQDLDITLLNSTLEEAIDYTYKLYNNVNDIVGMAVMVENSIVYGNRYRAFFPELDSELTKAEIAYQNGEYTHALKTVINAMEKFQPGAYEQLVKE